MKAVTIETKSDGKTSLVFGPEVDPKKQLDYVKKLKVDGLPDKVAKVEMWSRADGFRIAAAVSKKDLDAAKKEGEKVKKEYEAKKAELEKEDDEAQKKIDALKKENALKAKKHLEDLKAKNGNVSANKKKSE